MATPTEKLDLRSMSITEEQHARLKELFPEIFTESGKIDFDRLKLTLGETVDVGKERYGMVWPGKADCFKTIQRPSVATLRPRREESVNFDTTGNVIIEGDNLEVLKLLQKAYLGKIKMIYIDPPYNTGNDFIYPDDYAETLQTYLQYSGQIDGEGKRFSTNTESDGRFHTKWLSMMYPRLYLARNLLSADGVIFVSIGDQELHNLRNLMNEVFGEENYINTISVKAKPAAGASGGGEDRRLKKNIEFLLVYVKDRESSEALDLEKAFDETELAEHIEFMRDQGKSWKYTRAITSFGIRRQIASTQDGDGNEIKIFEHEDYEWKPLSELTSGSDDEIAPYLTHFDRVFRDTNAQSSIRTRVIETLGAKDGLFSIDYVPRSGKNKGGLTTVYYKGPNKDQIAWLKDIARKQESGRILIRSKTGTLWADFNWNNVTKEGDVAFPNGKKPIAFIQRMISIGSRSDRGDIILDFFAGSGSTGHAVLASNKDDGGNRRYVMVQLPELTGNEDFPTVSSICRNRMKRVASQLQNVEPTLISQQDSTVDLGFRSFALFESNFKVWQGLFQPDQLDVLSEQLNFHVSHVEEGRNEDVLLYEILLKSGFPLTATIHTVNVNGGTVYSIADGAMLIFLGSALTGELVKTVADRKPQRVVCLDESFAGNDQLKTNTVQLMKSRGIVFRTV